MNLLAKLLGNRRAVMAPSERRRLGKEYEERHAKWRTYEDARLGAIAEAHGGIRDAEARLAEGADFQKHFSALQNARVRLATAEALPDARESWGSWRDATEARLWDERPLVVDELLKQLRSEADALAASGVESLSVPPNDRREGLGVGVGELLDADAFPRYLLHSGARSFTNEASVGARVAALHALREDVERWTRRGLFGSEAELNALFDAAYRKLPAVESAVELARRDERGAAYLKTLGVVA